MSTQPAQGLTQSQVAQFHRDGFVSGMELLTEAEMAIARRKLEVLERTEKAAEPERWADYDYQPWSARKHPLWHWFQAFATHPTLLAAVRSILGPNVLIRNADVFIKEPEAPERIWWHVDSTAPPEHAKQMLSAWIAITESSVENGCMRLLRGSHTKPLPPEVKDRSSLSFSKEFAETVDPEQVFMNLLRPGCMSLHGFRTVHFSGENLTDERRIGFVVRFFSPETTPAHVESGQGFRVCGDGAIAPFEARPDFPVSWVRGTRSKMM